jgi:N-formylglutamate deformylase
MSAEGKGQMRYINSSDDTARIASRCLAVSIPHAGEQIPIETPWLETLPEPLLMFDVDRYVDRLYAAILNQLEIPTVVCPWHRYAVDLNRFADDVDAASVEGNLNAAGKFPRGLHWSITTDGSKLMPGPMSLSAHKAIVQKYFNPFHAEIQSVHRTLQERMLASQNTGPLYHLDLHSMPSLGTREHRDPGERRADIVVSDCKGTSASLKFRDLVVNSYQEAGFKVAINWPYFGGRITEAYGKPNQGVEALQIEINRGLYMDEKTKKMLEAGVDADRFSATVARIAKAFLSVFNQIPKL